MTATTAAFQQLWTSGRALVQHAQEPNIPFGESLTSANRAPEGNRTEGFCIQNMDSLNFPQVLSNVIQHVLNLIEHEAGMTKNIPQYS